MVRTCPEDFLIILGNCGSRLAAANETRRIFCSRSMTRAPHLGFRGQQVLDYIARTIERDGAPPSYRMIADALGFGTTQDARAVVQRLERRGFVHRHSVGERRNRGWHRPVIALASTPTT